MPNDRGNGRGRGRTRALSVKAKEALAAYEAARAEEERRLAMAGWRSVRGWVERPNPSGWIRVTNPFED